MQDSDTITPPEGSVTLSDALAKWTTDSSVVFTLLDRIRDRYQEVAQEAHKDNLTAANDAAQDLFAATFDLAALAEKISVKTSGLRPTQVPSYYLDISISPRDRKKTNA